MPAVSCPRDLLPAPLTRRVLACEVHHQLPRRFRRHFGRAHARAAPQSCCRRALAPLAALRTASSSCPRLSSGRCGRDKQSHNLTTKLWKKHCSRPGTVAADTSVKESTTTALIIRQLRTALLRSGDTFSRGCSGSFDGCGRPLQGPLRRHRVPHCAKVFREIELTLCLSQIASSEMKSLPLRGR